MGGRKQGMHGALVDRVDMVDVMEVVNMVDVVDVVDGVDIQQVVLGSK